MRRRRAATPAANRTSRCSAVARACSAATVLHHREPGTHSGAQHQQPHHLHQVCLEQLRQRPAVEGFSAEGVQQASRNLVEAYLVEAEETQPRASASVRTTVAHQHQELLPRSQPPRAYLATPANRHQRRQVLLPCSGAVLQRRVAEVFSAPLRLQHPPAGAACSEAYRARPRPRRRNQTSRSRPRATCSVRSKLPCLHLEVSSRMLATQTRQHRAQEAPAHLKRTRPLRYFPRQLQLAPHLALRCLVHLSPQRTRHLQRAQTLASRPLASHQRLAAVVAISSVK